MADLFYSDEALNVKSAFYRANSMVFVEGDDDVLFWHEVFLKIPEASVEVESAGGSDQIDQYITKILSGELQAIAARDSDFLPHMADIENDPWAAAGFMDTLLRCEDETGGGLWEREGNLAGNSRLKLSSWSRSAV